MSISVSPLLSPAPSAKEPNGFPSHPVIRLRRSDFVLMGVLVWTFAGNPLIGGAVYRVLTSVTAVLLLTLALIIRDGVPKRTLAVLSAFIAIFALQAVAMGYLEAFTTTGFFARLIIAVAGTLLIRDFPRAFVQVMYWTALISLPIYALLIATHGKIAEMVRPYSIPAPDPHVLIYYFPSIHLTQNNAYFWEPGVYGGYLILGLLLLGACRTQFPESRYRWIMWVLFIALVSTKSTGGYITAPFAMFFHRKAIGKHVVTKLLLVFAAVLGAAYAFQKAEFLGGKIQAQFEMVEGQKSHWQLTRLGSLLSDWEQIRVHPFVGWGPDTKQRLGFVKEQTLGAQGNGLSNFTAEFGLLGLGLFLISSWNGFKSVFGGRAGAATLAVLIAILLLNDECFLNFPLFMSLMFLRGPTMLSSTMDSVQARTLSYGRGAAAFSADTVQ